MPSPAFPLQLEIEGGLGGKVEQVRIHRERHVLLPPKALEEMVSRVASVGRDKAKYLEAVAERRHHIELTKDGMVPHISTTG